MSEAELLRSMEQRREQTKKRQQMNKALRTVMTPLLRQHDFTGTCPRFRRLGKKRYDLLTVQFNKGDDSFLIEIGQCAPDWHRRERGADHPAEKLTTWSLPLFQRARIQPEPGPRTADCFQYCDAKTHDDYKRIAESVVPFMKRAVEMLDDFEHVEKLGKEYEDPA
jgi:hypothetical protein